MDTQKQIYKCNVCGHIVEVLHPGVGQLVCCGKPMEATERKNPGYWLGKTCSNNRENRSGGESKSRLYSSSHGRKTLYRVDRDNR